MRIHDTFTYQSPGHCMEKCRDEGFNYAAIQNLKCYCGAGKPSDDKKVSSDECDAPCAGWPDGICKYRLAIWGGKQLLTGVRLTKYSVGGGKNAWSLYTANNVLAEPSSTSEKASSSTLESQSDSESTTASGVSASASVSSPVKSTTTSSNGSSRTGSASSTSSSPGAPGGSSSTAVPPDSLQHWGLGGMTQEELRTHRDSFTMPSHQSSHAYQQAMLANNAAVFGCPVANPYPFRPARDANLPPGRPGESCPSLWHKLETDISQSPTI